MVPTDADNTPTYLSVEQMAAESGLPAGGILKALHRGDMPYLRMGKGRGKAYRVRRAAFIVWLDAQEQGGSHDGAIE